MKTSNILRIITFILLIVVVILFFMQTDEGIFRISILGLLAVSLGYQYAKKREDKYEK